MAKVSRARRRIASRLCRSTPYPLSSYHQGALKELCPKKCSKVLVKKDWIDATCSVCMEHPHNAVLLLCSSHDKGCRPYMCGTSFRHSNCLDQYKKAYSKVIGQPPHGSVDELNVSPLSWSVDKGGVEQLACPLCRGEVKGWTVVEAARDFLNAQKRSCMQENCPFVGNYKELRKHVKGVHPAARPREVDPEMKQKWQRLENERAQEDVISTIRSSMPGAMVFGDYVIEGNHYGSDSDEDEGAFDAETGNTDRNFDVGFDRNLVNVFFLLHAFGPAGNLGHRRARMERAHHNLGQDASNGFDHSAHVSGSDSSEDDHGSSDVGGGTGNVPVRVNPRSWTRLGLSGRRHRHPDDDGSHR